ncbi:MAG: lysylphosphatidylglycerol synthase transmembrane domain-containing protein [Myxococcota bacterium]|nr:lysylphosphatidylglycerol synthase transmembrane domain-containing protein [Myxococcota bacterium]
MRQDPPSTKSRRRLIGIAIRVVAVTLVLIWLFKGKQIEALGSALALIAPWSIAVGLGLAMMNMYLAAIRWRVLMHTFGAATTPATRRLLKLFLMGHFYNTFIPGAVGGDVIRAYCSRACFEASAGSYVVVASERIIGLAALGVIFSIGYISQPELIPIQHALWWAVGLGALCVGMAVSGPIARRLARWWSALPRIRSPRGLSWAFAISLLGHASTVVIFIALADALVPQVQWSTLALIVPLSLLASIVPIAILGIGPREAAMVGLLSLIGVSQADALALSLSFAAILIFVAIVGGLVHLIEGEKLTAALTDGSGTSRSSDEDPLQD